MENSLPPTREKIVRTVVDVLKPLDFVNALWEGGAVAFNRLDEWSDIDICVDTDDDKVEEVFPVVERALEGIAPIELKYEVPFPPSHHYSQAFYRLKGTSEFLLIDLAVFKHSSEDKLLEPEIHGQSRFHFNKRNVVECPALKRKEFMEELKSRVGKIEKRFDMFKCFFSKQLSRGNYIEARELYARLVLDSLVEVLRMKHAPSRYTFKTYYVRYDLPPDVAGGLKDLYFVRDEKELKEKFLLAEKWLRETIRTLNLDEIRLKLDDA
jgi:hypothetical protein